MGFRNWLESSQWKLYHGSKSPKIVGQLICNDRDSGWFGSGFYLTAYPDYAKRWGQYVHEMLVPTGKYAEVQSTQDYNKISYLGDAEAANQIAGGTEGWIANEHAWSQAFTGYLKKMGYLGVRVHLGEYQDAEVLVFDPSHIQVIPNASNTQNQAKTHI